MRFNPQSGCYRYGTKNSAFLCNENGAFILPNSIHNRLDSRVHGSICDPSSSVSNYGTATSGCCLLANLILHQHFPCTVDQMTYRHSTSPPQRPVDSYKTMLQSIRMSRGNKIRDADSRRCHKARQRSSQRPWPSSLRIWGFYNRAFTIPGGPEDIWSGARLMFHPRLDQKKKKKHRIYVLPCRGMAFIRRVTGQCLFPPMPAILFHTSMSSEKPAGISTVVVQQPFAEQRAHHKRIAQPSSRCESKISTTPKRPAVKAKKCKLKYYSVPTEDRVLVHTNCMRTLTTRSSP